MAPQNIASWCYLLSKPIVFLNISECQRDRKKPRSRSAFDCILAAFGWAYLPCSIDSTDLTWHRCGGLSNFLNISQLSELSHLLSWSCVDWCRLASCDVFWLQKIGRHRWECIMMIHDVSWTLHPCGHLPCCVALANRCRDVRLIRLIRLMTCAPPSTNGMSWV